MPVLARLAGGSRAPARDPPRRLPRPLQHAPLPTRSWRPAAAGWLAHLSPGAFRVVATGSAGVRVARGSVLRHSSTDHVDQSSPLLLLLNLIVALIAGVTVFGADNVNRTHRVLANQGASPTLVWLTQERRCGSSPWACLWLPYAGDLGLAGLGRAPAPCVNRFPRPGTSIGALAVDVRLGPALRQAIPAPSPPRSIAVDRRHSSGRAPERPLQLRHAACWPAPSGSPLALLVVTWVWTRDWLLDRLGYWRWARLAAYLAIASGLLVASYIYHRAYSLPEVSLPTLDQAYQNAVSQRQPAPARTPRRFTSKLSRNS